MPNTQFITLLIITVFSLLAGIVSAVVLFGQLNAKKRERAELERRLENTVGAAMNSSVGNASAELERRLQDRLKELSDALYRYNEQTKNDYERFKNALKKALLLRCAKPLPALRRHRQRRQKESPQNRKRFRKN